MKNIVFLGCENSHSDTFLKFISTDKKYSDVNVLGVYSEEKEAMDKLNAKYGVYEMKSLDEFAGKVDGVVITARHGAKHYQYAKPYIKEGVAMFIDKPITISGKEAKLFMKELENAKVKITGGSSLKHDENVQLLKGDFLSEFDGKTTGGAVRAPLAMGSKYGGFYFYAEHLVDMVLEIFGKNPIKVLAVKGDDKMTVLFRYDGFDVTGTYLNENYECYYAARYSEKHVKAYESTISGDSKCFVKEFDEFFDILNGKEQKVGYDEFIIPVFVLNAIERSLSSGKFEKIEY